MDIFDRGLHWTVFRFQGISRTKYQDGMGALGRWANGLSAYADIMDLAIDDEIIDYPYRPYGYIGVIDKRDILFTTPPPNIKFLKDASGYINFLTDLEIDGVEEAVSDLTNVVHKNASGIVIGDKVFIKAGSRSSLAIVREIKGAEATLTLVTECGSHPRFISNIADLVVANEI